MKTGVNKLSVASTSALVLTYVKSLYEQGWGKAYLSHIDFSQVKGLADELSRITPLFREALLLRKRMVRQLIRQKMAQRSRTQICILAAGLDPLALQITEYFPDKDLMIYEVDSSNMREKQEIYTAINFTDERVRTLQADINNTHQLMTTLIDAGYDPEQPALIIFEGIMHYISEEQFLSIMRNFTTRAKQHAVIMDYLVYAEGLPSEAVSKATEMLDTMESYIGSRLQQFNRKKILNLLSLLEADVVEVYDMQSAELTLDGQNRVYKGERKGMLEMISFHI
ncbi:class I SAM-dependent methyltransferase [Chitinophaga rhizophila]|uniref:Class I SAM-dependent methyltransferase n=1 Tax=Chitinophaga rhizophila TaxID=2866212 RepID=A0ABS7GIT3_9BACT|nr:class I SAM-dependent methyltransferase [Chitinophaga rhizophila]MBW8686582.1 class I SAM-dependent methyltransferase [Chitinophaga rhizophila]